MAITFESVRDPYGVGAAGEAIGQAALTRASMDYQKKMQDEERIKRGSALETAIKESTMPGATPQQKIAAFQKYAATTGDAQSVSPLINQLMKESTKQEEGQAALDFLKNMGVDVPVAQSVQKIPPASFLGAFTKNLKPVFEPESEKIEAKRSADFADQIVKDYQGAQSSKNRLVQMEVAAKSKELPTPAMVKTLEFFGLPLGILGNPLAEGYDKATNDYIKDVSAYFPGQIRNIEIESYLKSIPTLMNSDAGKEIIIKNMQLVNEQKESAYNAYKDILKENGGKKPRNLDVEILERTKEKRNEISEQLKQNFEKAVEMSKFQTEKVKQGTPITPNIALTYMKKAGGDRKKAEMLAKEDGYAF